MAFLKKEDKICCTLEVPVYLVLVLVILSSETRSVNLMIARLEKKYCLDEFASHFLKFSLARSKLFSIIKTTAACAMSLQ